MKGVTDLTSTINECKTVSVQDCIPSSHCQVRL